MFTRNLCILVIKGVGRKISGGGGGGKRKYRKNSTIKSLPGGGQRNSTIKPLSTISLPCTKIQGARPPCRHTC